jgi:hypothetical protein
VALLAGSPDDDPGTRPFRHISLSQSAAWYAVGDDGLDRFDVRPPASQRLRWRTRDEGWPARRPASASPSRTWVASASAQRAKPSAPPRAARAVG